MGLAVAWTFVILVIAIVLCVSESNTTDEYDTGSFCDPDYKPGLYSIIL